MANFSMPWVGADFDRKTVLLSKLQKEAYKSLLQACFDYGGELPDDDKKLAQITELDIRTWRKHRSTILAFFYRTEAGHWRQQRIDDDLARIERTRLRRQLAGQKGGLQTAIRWHRKQR
jgi:uncharacterized protein YdaU (DUF1376 family)